MAHLDGIFSRAGLRTTAVNHRAVSSPGTPSCCDSDGDGAAIALQHLPKPSLSDISHLALLQTQRNSVCRELHNTKIAAKEVQQSVSSLRSLAFRLVVRIVIKEAKIARAERCLADSRRHDYVHSRSREGRIAQLQSTLHRHDQRNQQLLYNLEQPAHRTIQCTSRSSHSACSFLRALSPTEAAVCHPAQLQQPESHDLLGSHMTSSQRIIPNPPGFTPSTPPPSPPIRISSRTAHTQLRRPSNVIANVTETQPASRVCDHALLPATAGESHDLVRRLEEENFRLEHELAVAQEALTQACAALRCGVDEQEPAQTEHQLVSEQKRNSKATEQLQRLKVSEQEVDILKADELGLQAKLSAAEKEVVRLNAIIATTKPVEGAPEPDIAGAASGMSIIKRENGEVGSFVGKAHGEPDAKTEPPGSKIQERGNTTDHPRNEQTGLSAELHFNSTSMCNINRPSEAFVSGEVSIENDPRILRESKMAFQKMVKELRDKGINLEILKDWAGDEIAFHRRNIPHPRALGPRATSALISESRPRSRVTWHGSMEGGDDQTAWFRELECAHLLCDGTTDQLPSMHQSVLENILTDKEQELQKLALKQPSSKPPRTGSRSFLRHVFRWDPRGSQRSSRVSWNSPQQQSTTTLSEISMQEAGLPPDAQPGPGGRAGVAGVAGERVSDVESRTWKPDRNVDEDPGAGAVTALSPMRSCHSAASGSRARTSSPASTLPRSFRGTARKSFQSTDASHQSSADGLSTQSLMHAENERRTWGKRMKKRMGL